MIKFTPKRRLTGGLRLPAHKSRSTAQPIKRGFIPPKLYVSARQARGAAATPIVETGQSVLRGDKIATGDSPDIPDVHAPTSGEVVAIEKQPVALATEITNEVCIVIETDGENRGRPRDAIEIGQSREERLRQISSGGIVGLGGAVYPTAAKLDFRAQECSVLIINGAECEPYIACDDMLMREAPEDVLDGAAMLCDLVSAGECIVAIERDKPQAIDAITAAAESLKLDRLRIAELPSIYPAGGERQLIEVLAGVEVPNGRYPSDFGILCQNVGTAYAVHAWLRHGEPLTSRIVTVTGAAVSEPANIEAMIGTPIADLIAACGGYRNAPARLIQGGSMMGIALASDTLPVTMSTNCIVAAGADEIRNDDYEWPCIRCGECASACPARLQPQDLLLAARSGDQNGLVELSLSECIECGCCDVVCPSHIPLTREFQVAKNAVRGFSERQAFSDASDQRYRQREERRRETLRAEETRREEIRRTLDEQSQRSEEIRRAVERARRRKAGPDDT